MASAEERVLLSESLTVLLSSMSLPAALLLPQLMAVQHTRDAKRHPNAVVRVVLLIIVNLCSGCKKGFI